MSDGRDRFGIFNKAADDEQWFFAQCIEAGLDLSAILNFDHFHMKALRELSTHGLTIHHLCSMTFWRRNDRDTSFSENYCDALISLMTKRGQHNRTADLAVTELLGLKWQQVYWISKGLNRDDVIYLGYYQIRALLKLRDHGLTASHLRLHRWPQLLPDELEYFDALVSLMTERGGQNRAADEALAELDGLIPEEVAGIAKGLNVADVTGLNKGQQYALEKLRLLGLTSNHLRSHPWHRDDAYAFAEALINLVTSRGKKNRTIDQALAELTGLTRMEAYGIAKGLDGDDVVGFKEISTFAIHALIELRVKGLTADHLRRLTQSPSFIKFNYYHCYALVILILDRDMNPDEAVNVVEGLDYTDFIRLKKEKTGKEIAKTKDEQEIRNQLASEAFLSRLNPHLNPHAKPFRLLLRPILPFVFMSPSSTPKPETNPHSEKEYIVLGRR